MNILDLVEEMGLEPRKTSVSQGGEYHSPCPQCVGEDRFMCWPEEDRYWCRQCDAKGDAIQFCRDFLGLSYRAACSKTKNCQSDVEFRARTRPAAPAPIRTPLGSWKEKAGVFTEKAHQRLLIDKTAKELILQRGLTLDTIRENQLGWNPVKTYRRRGDWGLEEIKDHEWMCLPIGIVIPIFEDKSIQKLKIRKSEWKEGDFYGKYYEVPGSSNMLPILGDPLNQVVVIVEAEFDGMLVIQEAQDLCACVALGGAQKEPHPSLRQWLLNRKLVLFALDFDDAGKAEYSHWQQSYPNLEPWPVPEEKSPGDYFKAGGNVRDWILAGIRNSGINLRT